MNTTSAIIGPSETRGASAAGSVRFHPFFRACEIKKAWKGPGITVADRASAAP